MRIPSVLLALAALTGCATDRGGVAPVEVHVLAINDFHGALEPPALAVDAADPTGAAVKVPAGGVAFLASALASRRALSPNSVTVSAGDLTSASPFLSSQFLDEPTVLAMNAVGLDLNAVGNHEFDRGPAELRRLQTGGCAKLTVREPCRVDRHFPGARFGYLAANVRTASGDTLFPATALRTFGSGRRRVKVGFIGLTLRETPTVVVPSAVSSLRFEDETETVNALAPRLRAQGADAVVVLIHQGLNTTGLPNDPACPGLGGGLLPILARLDPSVDLVVSGHTHEAYVCDHRRIDPTRPFLVTSAGRSGTLLTDIALTIDPSRKRVVGRRADNLIVQGVGFTGPSGSVPVRPGLPSFPADARLSALVARYAAAAKPIADRVVGRLAAPATRDRDPAGESVLGRLVADAQKRATGADIAFMNAYGLRADLTPGPGGEVTYGQLYAAQPFGNFLQVKGMTGRQIRAVLEQQFASGSNSVARPNMLQVSRGFSYAYDLRRPEGRRIVDVRLNGVGVADDRRYRVAVSNFLATGGDNFTAFRDGIDLPGAGEDLAALQAIFGPEPLRPPADERVRRLDAPVTR